MYTFLFSSNNRCWILEKQWANQLSLSQLSFSRLPHVLVRQSGSHIPGNRVGQHNHLHAGAASEGCELPDIAVNEYWTTNWGSHDLPPPFTPGTIIVNFCTTAKEAWAWREWYSTGMLISKFVNELWSNIGVNKSRYYSVMLKMSKIFWSMLQLGFILDQCLVLNIALL